MTDGKAQRPEGSAEREARSEPIPTPEGQGGGEDTAKLIEWCELQVQLRDYAEFMSDGVQRDRILHERNRYLQIARLLSSPRVERVREIVERLYSDDALSSFARDEIIASLSPQGG